MACMVNKSDLRISNFNNKKKINAMIHVMPSYINGEISVLSLLIKLSFLHKLHCRQRDCKWFNKLATGGGIILIGGGILFLEGELFSILVIPPPVC